MCGISGLLFLDRERPVRRDDLERMCRTMVHRGPDDEGFFFDGHVGLGMRRLNVIDLVTGHQPISNEDGTIWIVFNGEIYNYPDLRLELTKQGHKFSTNTDTETIIHLYEQYGTECVNKLNGMFAFAIWDRRRQTLFVARDRLGVKPLYYFFNDECFAFGSELKAVMAYGGVPKQIDAQALNVFLTAEYIPAPQSIFEDVKKLLPGHRLILKEGKLSIERYWNLRFDPLVGGEEDLCEQLCELLRDAIRLRLVSDVPLGAFLSGGLDSSSIVFFMAELMGRPVKTFSIGFDDASYNELQYARIIAQNFQTEHHELTIQPDAVKLVENLVPFLDEPFADVSAIPTYLVSKLARQHVTVVLSGDGGDELFAGYEWYVANKIASYYKTLPDFLRKRFIPGIVEGLSPSANKKGIINKVKRFVEGSLLPESLQHFRWSMFLSEGHKNQLFSDEFRNSLGHASGYQHFIDQLEMSDTADTLWRQQIADIKTYLVDDILVKVDRMSMANSLEVRTPFLDYRVVEFAASVPSNLKLKGFKTKYLLKRSMAAKLPQAIVNRKKEGFSIPMKNWLRRELSPMMYDLLSPDRINREGYFNSRFIEKLKETHVKGAANYSHQLWALMMFELWLDSYRRETTQACNNGLD